MGQQCAVPSDICQPANVRTRQMQRFCGVEEVDTTMSMDECLPAPRGEAEEKLDEYMLRNHELPSYLPSEDSRATDGPPDGPQPLLDRAYTGNVDGRKRAWAGEPRAGPDDDGSPHGPGRKMVAQATMGRPDDAGAPRPAPDSLADWDMDADARLSFSDFMTGFFRLVWPKMSVAAADVVNRAFSKALDDSIRTMPALNSKVSYDVQFGDIAPKIGAVHGYRKHMGADVGIEICGELRWEATVDMKVRVGPMLIGVNRVCLNGTGCIVLKPLLDREPVIGGMQMFFCDMPDLDLGLTGLGGISAWSLVSTAMRNLLNEAFRRMMVLPHRMSVRFANTVVNDMPSFKRPPPRGIFRVRLVDARDLVCKDWTFRGRQSCDPYCVLSVGNSQERSRTIRKTTQPDWNTDKDVFYFFVYHERQMLKVDLYHTGSLKVADARLGSVPNKYTILQLLRRQEDEGDQDIRLPIHTSRREAWAQSTVALRVDYHALVQQHGVSPTVPFAVNARIYHADGLLPEDAAGAIVRLRVGNKQETTKRCKGVHPKDVIGFGKRQSEVIVNLHREGVSPETLAAAYGLSVDIVQEVVDVSQGKFRRQGWDETLTMLIRDPADTRARLEILIRGQWLLIGNGPIDLERFACSEAQDFHKRRGPDTGGGQCWKIHAYQGGDAYVGVSITVASMADEDLFQIWSAPLQHYQSVMRTRPPTVDANTYDARTISEEDDGGEDWCDQVLMALGPSEACAWSDQVGS